jgi:hypothetical protein
MTGWSAEFHPKRSGRTTRASVSRRAERPRRSRGSGCRRFVFRTGVLSLGGGLYRTSGDMPSRRERTRVIGMLSDMASTPWATSAVMRGSVAGFYAPTNGPRDGARHWGFVSARGRSHTRSDGGVRNAGRAWIRTVRTTGAASVSEDRLGMLLWRPNELPDASFPPGRGPSVRRTGIRLGRTPPGRLRPSPSACSNCARALPNRPMFCPRIPSAKCLPGTGRRANAEFLFQQRPVRLLDP